MGDDIKMDFKKLGWQGVDWMNVAQDRGKLRAFVNTVMNIWCSIKFGGFLD